MDLATKNATRMDNITLLLGDNSEQIKQINKRMDSFEQALSFSNSQIEQTRTTTNDLSSKVSEQASLIDSLVNKLDSLEKKVKQEAVKRDNSEAIGRKQNLEISGIPRVDPEPEELLKQ